MRALQDIFSELWESADSGTALGLAEEAVRLADARNDAEASFAARLWVIRTSICEPQKDLVALSWCLAKHEEDPERFPVFGEATSYGPDFDMFWLMKWCVSDLSEFPSISREEIEKTLDQMEQRCLENNISLRPVHRMRIFVAYDFGEYEDMHKLLPTFLDAKRDDYADCYACDIDLKVKLEILKGDLDSAEQMAASVFSRRYWCDTVPARTYWRFIIPMLLNGRTDDADRMFRESYFQFEDDRRLVWMTPAFLQYHAFKGDIEKALTLFSDEATWLLDRAAPLEQLNVALACWYLFEKCEGAVELRLPSAFEHYDPSGVYSSEHLATVFYDWAIRVAKAFDVRNGNGEYMRRVETFITPDSAY